MTWIKYWKIDYKLFVAYPLVFDPSHMRLTSGSSEGARKKIGDVQYSEIIFLA